MAVTQLTYVYGVRKSSPGSISGPGIGGAELRQIDSEGIAALVSELPNKELQLGKEELTAHARVLETALEHGTVLPMRFGVVLESPDAVQSRVLDAHKDELQHQLEQFEGKVELSAPAHERMVFSASFLVDRDRIAEFDQAVDETGRQHADRMRLKYTGPLPPHSFAELSTAEAG